MVYIMDLILFITSSLISIKSIDTRVIWKNDIILSSDSLSSDLERIPEELLDSMNLVVDEEKFERLNNYVKNLLKPKPEYHEVIFEDYNYHTDYDYPEQIHNQSRKRGAKEGTDYDKTTEGFVNGTEKEYDYDLEEFKKEYDSITLPNPDIQTPAALGDISLPQPNDDRPFEASDAKEKTNRYMKMAGWKLIFFGIPCFWYEVNNLGGGGSAWTAVIILLRTLLSWSVLLTLIATVMWCYKGACCCCLHFDILHPDKAMRNIKNSALQNPPGVEKLADGSINTYQPSRQESKAYKRLMDQLYS